MKKKNTNLYPYVFISTKVIFNVNLYLGINFIKSKQRYWISSHSECASLQRFNFMVLTSSVDTGSLVEMISCKIKITK